MNLSSKAQKPNFFRSGTTRETAYAPAIAEIDDARIQRIAKPMRSGMEMARKRSMRIQKAQQTPNVRIEAAQTTARTGSIISTSLRGRIASRASIHPAAMNGGIENISNKVRGGTPLFIRKENLPAGTMIFRA